MAEPPTAGWPNQKQSGESSSVPRSASSGRPTGAAASAPGTASSPAPTSRSTSVPAWPERAIQLASVRQSDDLPVSAGPATSTRGGRPAIRIASSRACSCRYDGIGVSLATYAWLIRPTISNAQPWKVKTASALPGGNVYARPGASSAPKISARPLASVTVTGSAARSGVSKRYSWKG